MTQIFAQSRGGPTREPSPLPDVLNRAIQAMTPAWLEAQGGGRIRLPGRTVAITEEMAAAARAALPAFEAALRPDPASVPRWMALLNSVVANPVSKEDFAVRVAALAYVLDDMPRAAFCKASLQEAMRRFKFWPSAAELVAMLDEFRTPAEDRVYHRRQIARRSA